MSTIAETAEIAEITDAKITDAKIADAEPPVETISIGERMKKLEHTDSVPPEQSFIVRADGHCFSNFTSGLPKPFDAGFCRAMVKTANSVLEKFCAQTVFVCSDEITAIFAPQTNIFHDGYSFLIDSDKRDIEYADKKGPYVHIFNGRHKKIETLFASYCSVMFNKYMMDELNEEGLKRYKIPMVQKIKLCEAIFDARLIPIPIGKEYEIVNNIIWRSSYDCYRNTTSSYGRYLLGHKECQNKNSKEMIEMMMAKGFDYVNEVPFWYKYGVLCKKQKIKYTGEAGEYYRIEVYNFCYNLIKHDKAPMLELLLSKYYDKEMILRSYLLRHYDLDTPPKPDSEYIL